MGNGVGADPGATVPAGADVPVRRLFVDTSSLLDLVRDPTRDPTRDTDRRDTAGAADRVIAAAVRGGVEILWPTQVEIDSAPAVVLRSLDRLNARRAPAKERAVRRVPSCRAADCG